MNTFPFIEVRNSDRLHNNPYAYRFNNNISNLKNNLNLIVPLDYVSFYKVKDRMVLFPDMLDFQINLSVARRTNK